MGLYPSLKYPLSIGNPVVLFSLGYIHRRTFFLYSLYSIPKMFSSLCSSSGINNVSIIRIYRTVKMNVISVPITTALPNSIAVMARYTGFRLIR